MKYIIVKDRQDKEYAIIFPEQIIHKDVARIHRASDVRVISAGFCQLNPAEAWGESDSLKMKSRPEDSSIIGKDFDPEMPKMPDDETLRKIYASEKFQELEKEEK